MKIPLPPLRYSIPGILLLAGLLLGGLSTFYEIRVMFRRLEEVVERHADFIGSQTSGQAATLLEENNPGGLTKQISQLGADQGLRIAMVLDDKNEALFSSRFEYRHKNFQDTPWAFATPYLTNSARATTFLVKNRSRLIGVFPFNLPTANHELISHRRGIVFLEYDLSHPKRLTIHNLAGRMLFVLIALAFCCVLVWWIFYKAITERIDRLVKATRDLASGKLDQKAALGGSDELAVLSHAFDQMAEEISRRTVELRQANGQMKKEIEDRKTAEGALRRSEILFRSVWENSGNGMRLTDEKGLIRAVNPAYCELVSATEGELLDQPFIRSYAPSPEVNDLFNRYLDKFSLGRIGSGTEKRVTFRSGQIAFLAINNSYIEVPSGEIFLLSILRNVTDKVVAFEKLKRAKEFSENLIETANVLIIGITETGNIQIFNEAAEKLSGFSRSEVNGKRLFEMLIPEGRFPEAPSQFITSRNGKGMQSFEHVVLTKSGEERIISWQTNCLQADSDWAGTICFGIDITERRKQEEERLEFERRLLDTQKLESLGVMAGGIAHDFNNLLTAILGNTSLASMRIQDIDLQAKIYLDHVENACSRAAELCKQMLAYSGRGRVVTERVNLNDLINELTALLDITIPKKVTFQLNLSGSLPLVEGDKSQFHQVIMNLIINASEAIGEESGTLVIETGAREFSRDFLEHTYLSPDLGGGNYVFVSVTDTGCGMSAETKAKIFDPFFTTKFTGRGLGLAAVLGIVRGHKGALKVESEPGKGSVFTVLLPASEIQEEAAFLKENDPIVFARGDGVILVADDEAHIVQVIRHGLRIHGFETVIVGDGKAAVEAFKRDRERIIAILLDLTMPVMNGVEAFKLIKELSPNARIILMSGYPEHEINSRFPVEKPDGFLQKPFDVQTLAATLFEVIQPGEAASHSSEKQLLP